MDTTQTPIRPAPDLNSLIRLYFDPNLEIPDVADRLGISILDLSDYLLEPHVRAAVRRVRAMYRARAPHLAAASLHRNLKLLDSIAVLPDNPTPADRDRLRRTLDSSRRAADLLFKTTRPTPAPSSRATPSRISPSHATTLRASSGAPPSLNAPSVPSVPSSSPAGTPPLLKAPSVPSVPSVPFSSPASPSSPSSSPRPTNELSDSDLASELAASAQEIRELVHELTSANPALAAEIAASLQSTLAAA